MCNLSTFKAKEDKVRFFKTLVEIIYKFTWDQVIIDSQLNFTPRRCIYYPWIEIKSKLNTFFNKPIVKYPTQYKFEVKSSLTLN